MNPHVQRLALGPPLAPRIAKISNQFLLLGIHGDHGLAAPLELADLLADMPELRVPVGVAGPFAGLAIALQAIARPSQQRRHRLEAYTMARPVALGRQFAHALAGPKQGRLRVASRRALQQRTQRRHQSRIGLGQGLSPAARTADPFGRKFPASTPRPPSRVNGRARKPGGLRHGADPAATERLGFHGNPAAPRVFIQGRRNPLVLHPNPSHDFGGVHTPSIGDHTSIATVNVHVILTRRVTGSSIRFRLSVMSLAGRMSPYFPANCCFLSAPREGGSCHLASVFWPDSSAARSYTAATPPRESRLTCAWGSSLSTQPG